MWLFTTHGFFSVVCARSGDGGPENPIDPGVMVIRARTVEHLKLLAKRFPGQLGKRAIVRFRGTDYAYRIFVPSSVWQAVAELLASEIDYGNFKDEVFVRHGANDYEESLHEVWRVMRQLQAAGSEPSLFDRRKT